MCPRLPSNEKWVPARTQELLTNVSDSDSTEILRTHIFETDDTDMVACCNKTPPPNPGVHGKDATEDQLAIHLTKPSRLVLKLLP